MKGSVCTINWQYQEEMKYVGVVVERSTKSVMQI